jgi:hypothetical protein
VLALFLGKRARISEVMDAKSTPGETKKMVRHQKTIQLGNTSILSTTPPSHVLTFEALRK